MIVHVYKVKIDRRQVSKSITSEKKRINIWQSVHFISGFLKLSLERKKMFALRASVTTNMKSKKQKCSFQIT